MPYLDNSKIDEVSTIEMLKMFNEEDKKVALAVAGCLPDIARAVDLIVAAIKNDGRLIYIGSGTSGKLAVIDASECPPTFGTEDMLVRGIISGGNDALAGWKEETEDDENLGRYDLQHIALKPEDVVVGISASGNTPYVIAALKYAKHIGCKTVGLCCAAGGRLSAAADVYVEAEVGPEAIIGSTRLKAGTAQKMILNMLSSGTMIKLGKTFGNLMVDVRPINKKLQKRVLDIIKAITACTDEEAELALRLAEGNTKAAVLIQLLKLDKTAAESLLAKHEGHLKKAIGGI